MEASTRGQLQDTNTTLSARKILLDRLAPKGHRETPACGRRPGGGRHRHQDRPARSRLRPRHRHVPGVNGCSSGAVSWGAR